MQPIGKTKHTRSREIKASQEDSRITVLKDKANVLGNKNVIKMVDLLCRNPSTDIIELEKKLERLSKNPSSSIIIDEIKDMVCQPFDQVKKKTPSTDNSYQSKNVIIINERSKFIASLLIDSQGKIDLEAIEVIEDLLKSRHLKTHISNVHDQVLLRTLEAIKTDSELVELLNSIKEPYSNANVQSIITATLGLETGTELTAEHSKQAVLSAMLSDIRQGQMASCFATAVAIKMHDQHPKQVAQEMKDIVETGMFIKEVDGKQSNFYVPKIYIPTKYGAGIEVSKDNIENILNTPGIKKSIEMVGLDINKDKAKLTGILEKLIEENPKNLSAVFSGFIDKIVLEKSILKEKDFEKAKALDEAQKELRELKLKLTREKYNAVIEAIQKDDKASLESLETELSKGVAKTVKESTTKVERLIQNVPANYDTLVKEHHKLTQQLEMNFLAAGGENSLLRSWEYSLAAFGRTDDRRFMAELHEILIKKHTPLERIWNQLIVFICNLIGKEVESQVIEGTTRLSIAYVLDSILDQNNIGYGNYGNFDRNQFSEDFAENFDKLLGSRLITKFEEGVFRLYDKTKSSNLALAIPLDSPEAVRGAIANIAYQAAEDSIKIDDAKNQRLAKSENLIGGRLSKVIWNEAFLNDLMIVYAHASGIKPELTEDKLESQFMEALERGFSAKILAAYTHTTFKPVSLNKNPESFIKDMVYHLKDVNAHMRSEILFPITASFHDFLLKPNMKMLNEVINAEGGIDAWIQENLIDGGKTFIIADLNWEIDGQHCSLAIKANAEKTLEFVGINERGEEISLPASDSNHHFGDSGFEVMLEVS